MDIPPVDQWPAGPGTSLRVAFAAAGFPSCSQCLALAWQMNLWGPDGCRKNIDGIVADILPRAKSWLASRFLAATRFLGSIGGDYVLSAAIRNRVLAAISESEKS